MIVSLKGILQDKQPNRAVVDIQGVGYETGVSTQTFTTLPAIGEAVFLHIYHHITENEQRLFGFSNPHEKSTFELLITVKGIGPRLALTILSGMNTHDLASAITRQDTVMLARTPGIGKKTAERVVLELKDKFGSVEAASGGAPSTPPGPVSEAASALEALGFKRSDAESALSKVRKEQPDLQDIGELVRSALKLLYR